MKKIKKLLAMMLAAVMAVSMLPLTALAEDIPTEVTIKETVNEDNPAIVYMVNIQDAAHPGNYFRYFFSPQLYTHYNVLNGLEGSAPDPYKAFVSNVPVEYMNKKLFEYSDNNGAFSHLNNPAVCKLPAISADTADWGDINAILTDPALHIGACDDCEGSIPEPEIDFGGVRDESYLLSTTTEESYVYIDGVMYPATQLIESYYAVKIYEYTVTYDYPDSENEPATETSAFAWIVDGSSGLPVGPASITLPDGSVASIGENTLPGEDFLSGADFVDGVLYGVSFNGGGSTLYEIDPVTGALTQIGGSSSILNGFTYDVGGGTAYACTGSHLYKIDLGTGALTPVGAFVVLYMVGIAADNDGNLYGIDLQTNSLYSIHTVTGAATKIGELGFSINYAQDIAYDRDNGILYGTLYNSNTYSGGLYVINTETGAATLTYDFGVEIDGLAIPYGNVPATTYTVTISGGGSGASGDGDYEEGDTVTIKAGNKSGYTFTGWTSDDVTITNAGNKTASFTMPASDVTVTADWTRSSSGGGGSSSDDDRPSPKPPATPAAPQWLEQGKTSASINEAKEKGHSYALTRANGQYGVRAAAWSAFAGYQY